MLFGSKQANPFEIIKKFANTRSIFGEADYKLNVGVGFMDKKLTLANGIEVQFQIWDQSEIETSIYLQKSFLRGADGAVLVFDSQIPKSWDKVLDITEN